MLKLFLPQLAGLVVAIAMLTQTFAADITRPRHKAPREICVAPGNKPTPGQAIVPDKTCPKGLRWRNPP